MTLLGSQEPTYRWAPPAVSSAGLEAVELGEAAGLIADPWQARFEIDALGEDRRGRWVTNEVAHVVGRQNGKGGCIELRELAGIFLFGERGIAHTAHQFKTSGEAFKRMLALVEGYPDFDRRVMKISRSKGEEGFIFKVDGQLAELRYIARSGGSGRGFAGMNVVVLDEAMILDDGPIAALLPTLATSSMKTGSDWQVWYMASAGDVKLATSSVVLARIRRRGYRQDPSLCFWEWRAHTSHYELCKPDRRRCQVPLESRLDPAVTARVNPAYGVRISDTFFQKMRASMAPWDYDREFLGVGTYPSDDAGWLVISEQVWADQRDPDAVGRPGSKGEVWTVGVDTAFDRATTSVTVTGRRADGTVHIECVTTRPGSGWVLDYCRELHAMRPKPRAFVIHSKGPASILIPDFKAAKLPVHAAGGAEYASWCEKALQLATEEAGWRHLDQPGLNTAVKVVTKHDLPGGSFVWEMSDVAADVTPWTAGTLALGGLILHGAKPRRRPLVATALTIGANT